MQCLQFGFSKFSYIFMHTKHICKLQHEKNMKKIVCVVCIILYDFLVNPPSIFTIDQMVTN